MKLILLLLASLTVYQTDEIVTKQDSEDICQNKWTKRLDFLVDTNTCDTSVKINKTCRRFVAIVNDNVSLTSQRDPLLKAIQAFEYIGTKKVIGEPEKNGDVFLSTNFKEAPILIYNWANDGDGLKYGWQGSQVDKGANWTWSVLQSRTQLFLTSPPSLCTGEYIDTCTTWQTKQIIDGPKKYKFKDDPGLSFECDPPRWTWSAWKNTTDCTLSNSERGCGQGKLTQNRTCIPRNIENCPFEVREINCSIPCTTTEKVADITTMVSLSVETKDTANDSETIETTDTTKKTDDQRTNPDEKTSTSNEEEDGATKGGAKSTTVENITVLFFSIILLRWKMTITN